MTGADNTPAGPSSDAVDRLLLEELAKLGPLELQPHLTAAELDAILREHQDLKKRLLCAPEHFERLSRAVADAGFGPYIEVVAHQFLDGDVIVLAASEYEMREMLQAKLEADLHRNVSGGRLFYTEHVAKAAETQQEPET